MDLRNFERVLWAMSLPERQSVVSRLGVMCVYVTIPHPPYLYTTCLTCSLRCVALLGCPGRLRWNPMRPDGAYRMDLALSDQRALAECLVHLAVVEPGEHEQALRPFVWWRGCKLNRGCVPPCRRELGG